MLHLFAVFCETTTWNEQIQGLWRTCAQDSECLSCIYFFHIHISIQKILTFSFLTRTPILPIWTFDSPSAWFYQQSWWGNLVTVGPVHTSHFCPVVFNSIKCGRNSQPRTVFTANNITAYWQTTNNISTSLINQVNSQRHIQLFRERLSNWKALKRTRQYRKVWWVVVVHCCIVKFTSFQRDGRRCYEYLFACVKRNKMNSEFLLKFIEYFLGYLSALSRTLLRFFLDNLCRNSCIPSTDVPLFTWLWRWLLVRLSKRQSKSLQTVLLRTTLTRMIIILEIRTLEIRLLIHTSHFCRT